MPPFSLRPKNRSAPRWGQVGETRPMDPSVARKARRSSPRTVRRKGGPSRSGSWALSRTGCQKRRNKSPIGVFGPVRVNKTLSASVNMVFPPFSHAEDKNRGNLSAGTAYRVKTKTERRRPELEQLLLITRHHTHDTTLLHARCVHWTSAYGKPVSCSAGCTRSRRPADAGHRPGVQSVG